MNERIARKGDGRMRVTKASQAGEKTRLGREELEQINRLARRELTEGEGYAFSVRQRGGPGRGAV